MKISFKKNITEKNIIILLILLALAVRLPAIVIFGDTELQFEWKFLVENLIEYKQLAWKNCEFDYSGTELCLEKGFLLPNLWMPPLYAYYLYLFSFLSSSEQVYIQLVLLSQAVFATISIVLFYKLNKNFFSRNLSFFSSLLFSFFPLYVYACTQISSISLQVFLTILFLYSFFKLIEKRIFFLLFLFAFSGGLLILLRGEFYAILILTLFYLFFFFKLKIKNILLITLITLISVSPYLIRNVIVFEKFTMIKSFGYNLWKGNHPYALKNSLIVGAEMVDKNLQAELDKIPRDKNYRFHFDKLFLNRAIKNITENPKDHFFLFIRKAFSFLLIDLKSPDPNYYNRLHYLPVLLIGVTSILGMIISNKKSNKLNYLLLIFFAYVFIFSTVSILPRYKLIILPIQIIFTNVLIQSLNKFLYRNER